MFIFYEKLFPMIGNYLIWASHLAISWKGLLVFWFLYLIGILIFIPHSILAIALGYTLQHASENALCKKLFKINLNLVSIIFGIIIAEGAALSCASFHFYLGRFAIKEYLHVKAKQHNLFITLSKAT